MECVEGVVRGFMRALEPGVRLLEMVKGIEDEGVSCEVVMSFAPRE